MDCSLLRGQHFLSVSFYTQLGQTCPQGQAHSIQNGGQSVKTLDTLQNTPQIIMVFHVSHFLWDQIWLPHGSHMWSRKKCSEGQFSMSEGLHRCAPFWILQRPWGQDYTWAGGDETVKMEILVQLLSLLDSLQGCFISAFSFSQFSFIQTFSGNVWEEKALVCLSWTKRSMPRFSCKHRFFIGGGRGGAGIVQWFDSQARHHNSVDFVVGSWTCSERFFSGYSCFPFSSKNNISKFQFDLDYCQALYHEPLAREIKQALPLLLTLNKLLYFTFWFLNQFLVETINRRWI